MSLTEYVTQLLLTCPLLVDHGVNVDLVEADPINYSISPEPVSPVLKRYRDGSSVRVFSFLLLARQYTTSDNERIANAALYENLTRWLIKQTRERALPTIDGSRSAQKIETVGSSYLLEREDDANSAVYSMQIQLQYYQKEE